ncbi:hypothetical protein N577_005375 [Lacticaseibacillus rhamnosus 2166]|nr:hypothetical protein LRH_04353 [Lacticaseibacillus rhamnosus HN001]ETW68655.1 hypothetical protein N577_005375 [Lacticaseibacillus rhamnosus 2166]
MGATPFWSSSLIALLLDASNDYHKPILKQG